MESIYDYMMRRLWDYRQIMTFQPVVGKNADMPITSFDSLVDVLGSVMKSRNAPNWQQNVDNFVKFQQGSQCCQMCNEIAEYQHLCPGKDLGWVEDDERSVSAAAL